MGGKPEVGYEQVLVNENEPATVTTSDVSGFGKFLTSFLAGLFHETEAGVYFVEVQATLVPVDGKSCGVPWLVICLLSTPPPPPLFSFPFSLSFLGNGEKAALRRN